MATLRIHMIALLLALCCRSANVWAQLLPGVDAAPSASDQVDASPLPVEAVVPDAAIQNRLQGVFDRIERFEAVQVEVDEGVVYLRGEVDRADARDKAERFAQRLEGVLFVANEIEVAKDVERRLAPAMDRIKGFLVGLVRYLPVLAVAMVLVLLAYGLAKLLTWSDWPYRKLGIHPLTANLVRRLMFVVVILVGVVIAIDLLDITALVGASIGAAGVIGIALGFAFRDIAENYLAGVLLSMRRPFNVRDFIRINEHEGHVVRLTPRELVLMTIDGNHVRLPNATVFKSVIYNFTANPRRQFQIDVGLDVEVDLVEAERIGVQALLNVDGVLADPGPFARVQRLAESSVAVAFFGWVDQRQTGYFKARSEAVRLIKQAFDEAGMGMPPPRYDLVVHRAPRISETPPKPRPTTSSQETAHTERSTAEESVVEEQIRQEHARSDEENLLTPKAD